MTQRVESGSYCRLLKLREIILLYILLRKSKIILISLYKNKLELTKNKYSNIKTAWISETM